MAGRIWYKRYGGDFIAGTLELNLEEKGAYSLILDMLNDRGDRVPDDAQWIARICGCSTRKWKTIRQRLLDLKKLVEKDGFLTNPRFEKQLDLERQEHENLSRNGKAGAEAKWQKSDLNGSKTPRKLAENILKTEGKSDENLALFNENKSLEEKGPSETGWHTRSQIPEEIKKKKTIKKEKEKPPQDFENFWALCPRKVAKAEAEKSYWKARKETTQEKLLTAMRAHRREMADRETEFVPHPSTWLNQKRYLDSNFIDGDEGTDKWPDWKFQLAARIGEAEVRSWFSTSEASAGVLKVAGKFKFESIKTKYTEDLKAIGVNEIREKRT